MYEFNKVVAIFNPDMADDGSNNPPYLSRMIPLYPSELHLFNNRGYPRINPDTMELQWYVYPDEYDTILSAFGRNITALGGSLVQDNQTPGE